MNPKYPETIKNLITYLKKLPGVGSRTAERFAFEFIFWEKDQLQNLGTLLSELANKIMTCPICGCLTQEGICSFCTDEQRDTHQLCILSSPRDVYAIEETRAFCGLYHIIENLISPLDGRNVTTLRIDRIEKRISQHGIKEVILAFDSTLEGDTTALYIKQQLSKHGISVTRLGLGIPVGSSLQYVDGGTLSKAFSFRQFF